MMQTDIHKANQKFKNYGQKPRTEERVAWDGERQSRSQEDKLFHWSMRKR